MKGNGVLVTAAGLRREYEGWRSIATQSKNVLLGWGPAKSAFRSSNLRQPAKLKKIHARLGSICGSRAVAVSLEVPHTTK
jgi:hypothetical protein